MGSCYFLFTLKIFQRSLKPLLLSSQTTLSCIVLTAKGCFQGEQCCRLQNDVSQFSEWADSAGVSVNAEKSADLCLGRKPGSLLRMGGQTVPRVSEKRHLGVSLTTNLRWTEHIDSLLKMVSAGVALCKSLSYRHNLPAAVIKRFYVSFIRSKLEYCSAVWCGASQRSLRRLERCNYS